MSDCLQLSDQTPRRPPSVADLNESVVDAYDTKAFMWQTMIHLTFLP